MTTRARTFSLIACVSIAGCGLDPGEDAAGQSANAEQPLCNTSGDGICGGPVPRPKPLPNPYSCSPTVLVQNSGVGTTFYDPTGNYDISTHLMKQLIFAGSCDGQRIPLPRSSLVGLAIGQVDDTSWGACDGIATGAYGPVDASGEWCTEFVRSMYLWSGVHDVNRCVTSFLGACIHREYLHDVSDVGDLRGLFSMFAGGWIDQSSPIGWSTPQPGDYLAMAGSAGGTQSHSGLAIGVSADARFIFTVEGNITRPDDGAHCVHFRRRDWFAGGQVDKATFGAVGKIDKF